MIRELPIRLGFRYAAGATSSRLLAALGEGGPILASPCPACATVLCPARSFCPTCGGSTGELAPVGPEGELLAWTEVPDKGTWGLVLLDGATTALLHRLLAPPSAAHPGARVRARYSEERSSSILALAGFELVGHTHREGSAR